MDCLHYVFLLLEFLHTVIMFKLKAIIKIEANALCAVRAQFIAAGREEAGLG